MGDIEQSRFNFFGGLQKDLPFLHSDRDRDVLRRDLAVTNANLGDRFRDSGWWMWLSEVDWNVGKKWREKTGGREQMQQVCRLRIKVFSTISIGGDSHSNRMNSAGRK